MKLKYCLYCYDVTLQLGWFAHPIFSRAGNYPALMITQVASNSIREGRSWSRLPEFSEKWIQTIRGSADFFGLNYYTSRMVESIRAPEGRLPSYYSDVMAKYSVKPEWQRAESDWLYSVPSGLGDLLKYGFEYCNMLLFQRRKCHQIG